MTAHRYRVIVFRVGRSTALRTAEIHLDPKDHARLREVLVEQVAVAAPGNPDLSRYYMRVKRLNNIVEVRRVGIDQSGRTVVNR